MQKNELFINGVRADLGGGVVAFTFQVNNIAEIKSRQGTFSNLFKLPKTANNKEIFENSNNVNSASNIPYTKLTADYYEDGLQIVSNGVARLVNSDAYFNVLITSGNLDFFETLKDLNISDLPIPTSQHLQTYANIRDSRLNTTGYIYPIIDWVGAEVGQFNTENVTTEYLLPALFVNDIIEACETLTGYKIAGEWNITTQNLIVTPKTWKIPDEVKNRYNQSCKSPIDNVLIDGVGTYIGEPVTKDLVPSLSTFEPNTQMTNNDFLFDEKLKGYFVVKGNYAVRFWSDRDPGDPTWNRYAKLKIRDKNTLIVLEEIELYNDNASGTGVGNVTPYSVRNFELITNNYLFEIGSEYEFYIEFYDVVGTEAYILSNVEFKFELIDEIPYNGTAFLLEQFNDYKVTDFLKDLMNLDCVISQANNYTKNISFDYLDKLIENIPNALDWSDKVHTIIEPKVDYTYGNYGQKNKFIFSNTEDIEHDFDSFEIEVNNEFLEPEKTAVQIKASSTKTNVNYWNETNPYARVFNSGTRQIINDNNYRFFILNKQDTTLDVNYKDTGSNTTLVTNSIPFCVPKQFEESKYEALRMLLYKTKGIDIVFYLRNTDVSNIDHLIPIYLNVSHGKTQLTGMFYLNKVVNYKGGLTKCELFRL